LLVKFFINLIFFSGVKSLWRPEYGSYMIEGTPGRPYGGLLSFFNVVEANMRMRRAEANALLNPDEAVMSLTSFPRFAFIHYIFLLESR